jgi:hypothetical protein
MRAITIVDVKATAMMVLLSAIKPVIQTVFCIQQWESAYQLGKSNYIILTNRNILKLSRAEADGR